MEKVKFDAEVARLGRYDYYQSPDFQCDQTGGFPTMLCVNWEEGKAWLELNPFVDSCGADVEACEQRCADFGIRTCTDIDDFNRLLECLGPDAVDTATLCEDEESDL